MRRQSQCILWFSFALRFSYWWRCMDGWMEQKKAHIDHRLCCFIWSKREINLHICFRLMPIYVNWHLKKYNIKWNKPISFTSDLRCDWVCASFLFLFSSQCVSVAHLNKKKRMRLRYFYLWAIFNSHNKCKLEKRMKLIFRPWNRLGRAIFVFIFACVCIQIIIRLQSKRCAIHDGQFHSTWRSKSLH